MIAAVALGGCAPSLPKCSAPEPKVIADALYGREQFGAMLANVARSTVTGTMVAEQDPAGFEKRLSVAIDHALDRHGKQWDANLGQAYSDTLDLQELSALCAAMNEDDKASFGRFADRVGPSMKAKSTPLLQLAGIEVLRELVGGSAHK
jgi:hypothetical protein